MHWIENEDIHLDAAFRSMAIWSKAKIPTTTVTRLTQDWMQVKHFPITIKSQMLVNVSTLLTRVKRAWEIKGNSLNSIWVPAGGDSRGSLFRSHEKITLLLSWLNIFLRRFFQIFDTIDVHFVSTCPIQSIINYITRYSLGLRQDYIGIDKLLNKDFIMFLQLSVRSTACLFCK